MVTISLGKIVAFVLLLLGAGAIFALLHYLIAYVVKQFPGSEGAELFGKAARIFLVVLGVLFLIGLILVAVGAAPMPTVVWWG